MGSRIIGIDFGTTSSVVAVMEGGKPTIIRDRNGHVTIPSLLAIRSDKSVVVGHDAVAEARKYSENSHLVASLKRWMAKDRQARDNSTGMPIQLLAAMILAGVKIQAESYLGERVEKAVIAVPAKFSLAQRQLTREAALIAGLEPLRIVNEATAAVCSIQQKLEGRIAIVDLGGGTLDVSVIDLGDGVFEAIRTTGDDRLGGDDFTSILLDLAAAQIVPPFDRDFIRTDPLTSRRFRDAVEDAKRELSSRDSSEISLPYVRTYTGEYRTMNCTVTRQEFERACEEVFQRLEKVVKEACSTPGSWKPSELPVSEATDAARDAKAKVSWFRRPFSKRPPAPQVQPGAKTQIVPSLWLIGNASRIPECRRRLFYKYRNWHPPGILDLKEPVALGAARIAGMLEGTEQQALLLDIIPNTLAIETAGGVATPMIGRNATFPTAYSHPFTTVSDNQTAITVKILEGERPLALDNRVLGILKIENLPLAKKGEVQIEVRFNVDTNGILSVTAQEMKTKRVQELRCDGLRLSDKLLNEYHQHVQRWIRQQR